MARSDRKNFKEFSIQITGKNMQDLKGRNPKKWRDFFVRNLANYDEVKTQLFRDCFVLDVVVMLF